MNKIISFFVLMLFFVGAMAQKQKAITQSAADSLFNKQQWTACVKAYQELIKSNPKFGRNFYRLGFSYHSLKQYDKAIEPYRKAIAIGNNATVMYNLACVFSRLNKADSAYTWIEKTIAAGYYTCSQLVTDADFEELKNEERFKALVTKCEATITPCKFDTKYREFDFWIGVWDVYNTQGQLAGYSKIELILDECIILENWKSTVFGSGKSFNTYNSVEGKWRQTWVDNQGSFTEFKNGEFKNNQMQFITDNIQSKQGASMQRLTFYKLDNGDVRQFGELSKDEGKTWATSYDLMYKRKK